MHSFFSALIETLINFINQIGYLGIFIGMFLESTVVPIPSELIMIPAGISAAKGGMNIYIATILGIIGNILGAIFSYYLASSIGRRILFYVGKYFFIKPATIIKIEEFFKSHGSISVFMARLIPGFRHIISLFAGIAKMNLKLFLIYTSIGSAIWNSVLASIGYFIGENDEMIGQYLNHIIVAIIFICVVFLAIYIVIKRKFSKKI